MQFLGDITPTLIRSLSITDDDEDMICLKALTQAESQMAKRSAQSRFKYIAPPQKRLKKTISSSVEKDDSDFECSMALDNFELP